MPSRIYIETSIVSYLTSRPSKDIIAEIHAARERLAEQYHNDLLAYSKAAESHCHALGFRFAESPRCPAVQENHSCSARNDQEEME